LPRAFLWQKLDDSRSAHLSILNQHVDKKIQQVGNGQVKKLIDHDLKDIDHILTYLKER